MAMTSCNEYSEILVAFKKSVNSRESLIEAINMYKKHSNKNKHIKFIYEDVVPLYSHDSWKKYVYESIIKSLQDGLLDFDKCNMQGVSRYLFDADYLNGRWVVRYPALYNILYECIYEDKNFIKSLREIQESRHQVKDVFLYALNNELSLVEPIKLYTREIGHKYYLNYIENVLLTDYGNSNFIKYVENVIKIRLMNEEGIDIHKISFSRLFVYIFGNLTEYSKLSQRHPRLTELICKGLENCKVSEKDKSNYLPRMDLIGKISDIQNYTEEEFRTLCNQVIEDSFISKRERINAKKFYRALFNVNQMKVNDIYFPKFTYRDIFYEILESQYYLQREKFINDNLPTMDLNSNIWILYYEDGASLRSRTFDFNDLNSTTLQAELKFYIKANYTYENIVHLFHLYFNSKRALNPLIEKFDIQHISEIDSIHVGYILQYLQKQYAIKSIAISFRSLSKVSDYLISIKEYKYRPQVNVFKQVLFHNSDAMCINTDYIPDEVMLQIAEHIKETSLTHQLIFKIFDATGMRAKEVLRLKENCCFPKDEYEGYIKLKYTPYKILKARRLR